jgi:hypothetical protein
MKYTNEFEQLFREINGLLSSMPVSPKNLPTADDVRGIVRDELRRADPRKRIGWLVGLGVLVPAGIWFAPRIARWADAQIIRIGEQIGAEAVRSAETESGLPITADGRKQAWRNILEAVGRTRLGRRWLKGDHDVPFSPQAVREYVLTIYEGQEIQVGLAKGQARLQTGTLRVDGDQCVVTATKEQDPDIVFDRGEIVHFAVTGEDCDLIITVNRYESTPRQTTVPQNGRAEKREVL